jgi:hypothetical protein
MKRIILGSLIAIVFFYSCQPLTSIEIETISPSSIDFPGAYNKIMFLNLDNDINDDSEIDTALYHIITKEMYLGFNDGIKNTPNIDSSRFIYYKQLPDFGSIYIKDTINWALLNELERNFKTDLLIVLDSIYFIMNSGNDANYYAEPFEYYKYREITIIAKWNLFDLYENKIIDTYLYCDTLVWDAVDTDMKRLERDFPSVVQNVREICYFSALDYSKRIFPIWSKKTRYFFVEGNKHFKAAAVLANSGKWVDASEIWKKYVKDKDKELASRACFNLAVANEILGNIDLAIEWAQLSFDIKEKKRTQYYILVLKNRKTDNKKLKYQL